MKRGKGRVAAIAAALLALAVAMPAVAGFGADHLDAPSLTSPAGRGQADINDVYVFEGADPDRTVLAMTANPALGVFSPKRFGRNIEYRINIDQNGDSTADLIYKFRFFNFGRRQYVVARRARAEDRAGRVIGFGRTGRNLNVNGKGWLFTGTRSDPFFFDLDGFLGTVEGVGARGLNDGLENDPFSTFNVSAIVLEVPDSKLGGSIAVWGSTHQRIAGVWTQLDRMGRPAINAVVNSPGPIVGADPAAKNVYNGAHPSDDVATFTDAVVDALQAFSSLDAEGAYSDAEAGALAGVLLPDVIVYDTSTVAAGPLNGRALADDVIDIELNIVTGGDPLGLFPGQDDTGAVTTDGIGPHNDYLAVSPYLGPPN